MSQNEKLPDDMMPGIPGKFPPSSKVEVFKWKMLDSPGRFMMISKKLLHIDHCYQRDNVRDTRVNDICREWSWMTFGVLIVAKRSDGTYYVVDGQHRKRAADKRSDIDELPCLVFDSTGQVLEAENFLRQTNRGNVVAIDAFKAKLARMDPVALGVQEMLSESGYRVAGGGHRFTVQCVGRLEAAFKSNAKSCRVAWDICVQIFDGESIYDKAFEGIFAVEKHLQQYEGASLKDPVYRSRVSKLTPYDLRQEIMKSVAYNGGGSKACGEGVRRILNKNCRTNLISPIIQGGKE